MTCRRVVSPVPTPLVRFRIDYGHGQIVVTQTNFGSPPAGAKRDASSIVRMADERPGSWRTFTRPSAVFDPDGIRCSFCGKGYADVEPIVCGPTLSVAICNECVDLCAEIIGEQRKGPTSTT
jgi:hypothetical protein